ncbi:MAG: hypothetical protein KF862_25085 [Chitinophagaceae bacterium]|nr:hypothetical protein [Chitinophagaceae bacterium]
MLSVYKPYLNGMNSVLPLPGDMEAVVNFLFALFNSDAKPGELLSRKTIKEWLLDFLEAHNIGKEQSAPNEKHEIATTHFYWDYDDVNDFRMK